MSDENGAEVADTPLLPCPHCGGEMGVAGGPQITYSKPDTHAWCLIACPCGHLSRTFDNSPDLREWWNMRGGESNEPKVKVTHLSKPRDEF